MLHYTTYNNTIYHSITYYNINQHVSTIYTTTLQDYT